MAPLRTEALRSEPVPPVLRLGLAALLAAAAAAVTLAVPPPADAATAHRHRPRAAAAKHGHSVRQVARGSRTHVRAYRSGNGRYNQNQLGVYTPSFLGGPQQSTVTNAGQNNVQNAYGGGDVCQFMR
ncbi:hypothetical protein [Microbispora triticiradicis]|uniref:Uncharacterized protein n=2 Tax=Microbispora TaxID=2005 RepID=A0ABY3M157_9ACTN|nr:MULTISPECIES: hypothetical protein [Microbispora]TLP59683.1 hypothetical protein FED44_15485 [Microbispora fusca]TYB63397.1 hypothetical protein FXF59_08645 [Microbispora tritici]